MPDCADYFGVWAVALLDAGIGYTIIDERQICEGTVRAGGLHLASGEFDTLIFPDVSVVREARTLAIFEEFSRTEGCILRSGSPPPAFD